MTHISTTFTNLMEETPHAELVRLVDFLRDQGVAAMDMFAQAIEDYYTCMKCKDTRKVTGGKFDDIHQVPCECSVDGTPDELDEFEE